MTLAAHGQFDDAIAEVRRGQALEPLSVVVHHHVAWIHVLARRYDVAIAECRSAIDMDPNFPMAHLWMGVSLEQQGQYDDAIASLERAVALTRGASIAVGALAHAYASSGRTDEARQRLSELRQPIQGRYIQHYGVALVLAALGESDEAMHCLEQAYRDHSFWLAYWANVDPRLDVLRERRPIQDLAAPVGSPVGLYNLRHDSTSRTGGSQEQDPPYAVIDLRRDVVPRHRDVVRTDTCSNRSVRGRTRPATDQRQDRDDGRARVHRQ